MSFISEKFHEKKLNDYDINIKTQYIVGNKILERNTNGSLNEDIKEGIRCKKEYFVHNKLLHTETKFDSRIEYTFVSSSNSDEEYTCPNCGMKAKVEEFIDGCPYCRSYYNIDYKEKDLGGKYHYDRVLRNTKYRVVTACIDFLVCLLLSFLFIKNTSRTFNSYDVTKVFIFGSVLSLILYYFFYILDAYIVLTPIKKYKDRENQKQIDFWNRTKIDKKTFFNNLNYEIRKKYYTIDDNIIDYDILDYLSFKEYRKQEKYYVEVKVEVRIIYYKNSKIISKYVDDVYILKRNEKEMLSIRNGINILPCPHCGASIDITKGYCEYCKKEIAYFQEWIIE